MFKSRAVMLIATCSLLIFALMMSACDKGDLKPNQAPTIEITSYGGSDSTLTGTSNLALFQQKIFWNAYDVDGAVKGYAYRILDEQGNPISTPGNDYIVSSLESDLVPLSIKQLGAEFTKGWVLHYETGAPDSIPLSSPNARRTIWTDQVSATINFPANINGVAAHRISAFQIVAIDNRGDISAVQTKYFNSQSASPHAFASSSQGVLDDAEIGQGIKLVFSMDDGDPYIGAIPWYYEYQIYRVKNSADTTGADTLAANVYYRSSWISTVNNTNIEQATLTKHTTPALEDNYVNLESGLIQSTPYSKTILVVRVVDLAGIRSERKDYRFHVNGKYYPETIPYLGKCYALGDYHYVEQVDAGANDVLPSIKTSEGIKIARPFFLHPTAFEPINPLKPYDIKPTAFKYTAVGRQLKSTDPATDLRVWLKWGYHGEYEADDPTATKKYNVVDSSGVDYQSEITYFHIQLDGQQYPYQPLLKPGMQPDPNWLRIPASHDIAQKIPLTKLSPGVHVLRIKAEDLQGKADRTPAEITFEVVAPTPVADRRGVLVITNESSNTTPTTLAIKKYYTDNLTDALEADSKFVYRSDWSATISTMPGAMGKFSSNVFAPSYLQQFKAVIYYHDYMPYASHNLDNEANAMRLFMLLNGKLILSGGQNITAVNKLMYNNNEKLLTNFLALPAPTNCFVITNLTNPPYSVKPFMIGATPKVTGYPTLDLDVLTNPISLVNTKKGLGTVSYFKNVPAGNILYRMVSKPVGTTPDPSPTHLNPTQAEFDEINDQVVALVKENGKLAGQPKVKSYAFGFPLSLMNRTQADELFSLIINN